MFHITGNKCISDIVAFKKKKNGLLLDGQYVWTNFHMNVYVSRKFCTVLLKDRTGDKKVYLKLTK